MKKANPKTVNNKKVLMLVLSVCAESYLVSASQLNHQSRTLQSPKSRAKRTKKTKRQKDRKDKKDKQDKKDKKDKKYKKDMVNELNRPQIDQSLMTGGGRGG